MCGRGRGALRGELGGVEGSVREGVGVGAVGRGMGAKRGFGLLVRGADGGSREEVGGRRRRGGGHGLGARRRVGRGGGEAA